MQKPGGQPGEGQSKSQKQQESGKQKDESASKPEQDQQGQKEEQGKPQQQGEKPGSDEQSQQTPQENQQGQMPERPTEGASATDPRVEVWGNLPIHLRDIFRAEGGVDVPAQYRDWIDSYYRRLNRRGE